MQFRRLRNSLEDRRYRNFPLTQIPSTALQVRTNSSVYGECYETYVCIPNAALISVRRWGGYGKTGTPLIPFYEKDIQMYFNQQLPPWWMFPPMGPTSPSTPPIDPAAQITQWKQSLEALEKAFKKEEKPKDKKPDGSVVGMVLFMLLMSPITGPVVFWLFQQNPLVHR